MRFHRKNIHAHLSDVIASRVSDYADNEPPIPVEEYPAQSLEDSPSFAQEQERASQEIFQKQKRFWEVDPRLIAMQEAPFPVRSVSAGPFLRRAAVLVIGACCLALLAVWARVGIEGVRVSARAQVVRAQTLLQQAEESLEKRNFAAAAAFFNEARRAFLLDNAGKSRPALAAMLTAAKAISFPNAIRSEAFLMEAAAELSQTGEDLSNVARLLRDTAPGLVASGGGGNEGGMTEETLAHIFSAVRALQRASSAFSRIDVAVLPGDIRAQALQAQELLAAASPLVDAFSGKEDTVRSLLGYRGEKTYLVLFQNSSELRATGGFVGTFGLLSVRDGRITRFIVRDSFDHDWQLNRNIIPPKPLQDISAGWSLHDANWFFDFPASAQKAAEFYELGGGTTPDGVIALTTGFIENLLKLTGPVELPAYGRLLSAENFVDAIQQEVEFGEGKAENRPKSILVDFAPVLLERLTGIFQNAPEGIGRAFLGALARKDMQWWMRDAHEQELAEALGASGSVADVVAGTDYLAVVSSNVNGFKTDRVIANSITHSSRIAEDGAIIDTVTLRREHRGGNLPQDFYNQVNKNYLRIYVPKGSELVFAEGFVAEPQEPRPEYSEYPFFPDQLVSSIEKTISRNEAFAADIFEESGKTVFGGWSFVSPGESTLVRVTYRLPFSVSASASPGIPFVSRLLQSRDSFAYRLVVQKQAGTDPQFSHEVLVPAGWAILSLSPESPPSLEGAQMFFGAILTNGETH